RPHDIGDRTSARNDSEGGPDSRLRGRAHHRGGLPRGVAPPRWALRPPRRPAIRRGGGAVDRRAQISERMLVADETLSRLRSAIRQLQLDAAIAAEDLFTVAFLERLKLAVAGGDEPVRGYATRDQITYDRDCAGCRKLPVGGELVAADGPAVRVSIDLQRPVDLRRDRPLQLDDGGSKLIDGGEALGRQLGLA